MKKIILKGWLVALLLVGTFIYAGGVGVYSTGASYIVTSTNLVQLLHDNPWRVAASIFVPNTITNSIVILKLPVQPPTIPATNTILTWTNSDAVVQVWTNVQSWTSISNALAQVAAGSNVVGFEAFVLAPGQYYNINQQNLYVGGYVAKGIGGSSYVQVGDTSYDNGKGIVKGGGQP